MQWFIKRRHLLQPGAWRLLREAACADYARRVVPPSVRAIRILFPQTVVTCGFHISVRTQWIEGDSLLAMLYEPARQQEALEIGLVVLEALYTADTSLTHFSAFGTLYRFGKGSAAAMRIMASRRKLSTGETSNFLKLLRSYLESSNKDAVLVHGDLHASHVVVDRTTNTVGLIDLEAMHIGKAATNFAQLWTGYHYADCALGKQFYVSHKDRFPHLMTVAFDRDVRIELALRAYSHVCTARHQGNVRLRHKAECLLHSVLQGLSLEEAYREGILH